MPLILSPLVFKTRLSPLSQMANIVCGPFCVMSEGKCWKENHRPGIVWGPGRILRQCKVALIAQTPNHIAAPEAIVVVDF